MRAMLDTNVLISAAVLSSSHMLELIDVLAERHTIVLSTYVLDELKRVAKDKFAGKCEVLEAFLQELPYELVYTPEKIDPAKYPGIRDLKDLPILATAIAEDVDVLVSGDSDFAPLDIERPEVMTPRAFVEKDR
jgi:putative PIN family toxin of toxin-antitoxin system